MSNGERTLCVRLGLGALVLVVRELQIKSAAVKVKSSPSRSRDITTHSVCHRDARRQKGGPARLIGFGVLHRAKSSGSASRRCPQPGPCAKSIKRLTSQKTVVGNARDIEYTHRSFDTLRRAPEGFDKFDHSGCSQSRAEHRRARRPPGAHGVHHSCSYCFTTSTSLRDSLLARAMILFVHVGELET